MPSPPPPRREAGGRDELRALERAVTELALYDWLVLRSARLAEAVLSRTGGALPGRLRIAAQGDAARRVLAAYEVEPALVVTDASPEALVSALAPFLGRAERVLVPLAEGGEDPVLRRYLASAGGEPVTVVVPPPPGPGDHGDAA